jgi:hypothetical protein
LNKQTETAYEAIKSAWDLTRKVRSLFPSTDDPAIKIKELESPGWYQAHGDVGTVKFANPVTGKELNQIGAFVNSSFIITMMAILEEFDVVPYKSVPDLSREGGKYVQLTKRYRNHFAHGDWEYNPNDPEHRKTRKLLQELLPNAAKKGSGFLTSIDTVLEPLKDGVLAYISAST